MYRVSKQLEIWHKTALYIALIYEYIAAYYFSQPLTAAVARGYLVPQLHNSSFSPFHQGLF